MFEAPQGMLALLDMASLSIVFTLDLAAEPCGPPEWPVCMLEVIFSMLLFSPVESLSCRLQIGLNGAVRFCHVPNKADQLHAASPRLTSLFNNCMGRRSWLYAPGCFESYPAEASSACIANQAYMLSLQRLN